MEATSTLLTGLNVDFLCHPYISQGLAQVIQYQDGSFELKGNYSSLLYGGHNFFFFSDLLFFVITDVVIRMSCIPHYTFFLI